MLIELPQDSEGNRIYEYVIPGYIPWGSATEQELVLEEALAQEWLEEHRNIVRSALLEEQQNGDLSITVRWLESSCPYCETTSSAKHERWVYVPDWENETDEFRISADLPYWENDDCLQKENDSNQCFLVYDGELPLGPSSHFEKLESNPIAEKPYGQSNPADAAICELSQGRFQGFGFPKFSKSLGSNERFAGTYHCECCGNYYSVQFGAFSERRISAAELNRMASSRSRPYSPEPKIILTCKRDNLAIDIGGSEAGTKIEFNLSSGITFIDGLPLMRAPSARPNGFAWRLLKGMDLFGDADFCEELAFLLPRSVVPGKGWLPLDDIRVLVIANRFRGYPKSFYFKTWESLRKGRDHFVQMALELPMSYRDIESVYWKTGLPDKKSLRRILFSNPLLLAYAIGCPFMPFRNVDILARMLDSARAMDYLTAFQEEYVCRAWWLMSRAKGDAATFAFLEKIPTDEVLNLARAAWTNHSINGCASTSVCLEKLRGRSIKDGFKELPYLIWECETGKSSQGAYKYSKQQVQLEREIDGYSFELASNPHDLISASIELHNCLDTYADRVPGDVLVFLIRRQGKVHGAVEVKDRKVIQAHTSCNRPLSVCQGVDEAFHSWCEQVQVDCEAA